MSPPLVKTKMSSLLVLPQHVNRVCRDDWAWIEVEDWVSPLYRHPILLYGLALCLGSDLPV